MIYFFLKKSKDRFSFLSFFLYVWKNNKLNILDILVIQVLLHEETIWHLFEPMKLVQRKSLKYEDHRQLRKDDHVQIHATFFLNFNWIFFFLKRTIWDKWTRRSWLTHLIGRFLRWKAKQSHVSIVAVLWSNHSNMSNIKSL